MPLLCSRKPFHARRIRRENGSSHSQKKPVINGLRGVSVANALPRLHGRCNPAQQHSETYHRQQWQRARRRRQLAVIVFIQTRRRSEARILQLRLRVGDAALTGIARFCLRMALLPTPAGLHCRSALLRSCRPRFRAKLRHREGNHRAIASYRRIVRVNQGNRNVVYARSQAREVVLGRCRVYRLVPIQLDQEIRRSRRRRRCRHFKAYVGKVRSQLLAR